MTKIKNYLLDLNFLRKNLRFQTFADAFKSQLRLKISTQVEKGRVLVLAPHPDDETIGCGGVLAKHAKQGDEIVVVYLADGGSNVFRGQVKLKVKEAVEVREQEARRAGKILGVSEQLFWRYPDGKLIFNQTIKKLLTNVISKFKPTTIYLPSFLDPHPDHFEVAKILVKTIESLEGVDPTIYLYEIWAPILINRLVTIDEVVEKKKEAVGQYRSQLQTRSYLRAILGLNQYRAGMFDAGEYAEGFFSCNTKLFLKLFEKTSSS